MGAPTKLDSYYAEAIGKHFLEMLPKMGSNDRAGFLGGNKLNDNLHAICRFRLQGK